MAQEVYRGLQMVLRVQSLSFKFRINQSSFERVLWIYIAPEGLKTVTEGIIVQRGWVKKSEINQYFKFQVSFVLS